ncbi:ATP-binding protein [uncultured Eudoraea sp.]|uniref:tetratricopeptide repeat-containing sensor histidine kinase n=1 Tax=uncultured Eudoraea sp. TaxID=1035614 RepID=UPI002624690B|nr:ATP-binding protein [uncultured Eudoraea sp.]
MVCRKHLILISLALLFFSCGEENQSTQLNKNVSTSDSMQVWIQNGRDVTLPPKIRKEYLQKAYDNASNELNDSLRLSYFAKLSYTYLGLKDSLNFRNSNKKARLLSEERKDSATLADLHWDLGDFYRNSLMKDSAYYEYSQAEQLYTDLKNNFDRGRVLYSMARIQKGIKDYTGAEINLIEAIELFLPLEKNRQLFLSYNLLGTIAKSLKEYEQARTYFAKASEFLNNMPQEELGKYPYTLNNNIGNSYKEQGDYSKAIPYFKKIINTDSLKDKEPASYALTLDNLGYSQYKIGQLKISETNLKEAMEINIQENAVDQVAMSHFHMADFYLAKRDTALALSNAEEALVLARQSNDNDLTLETLKLYPLLDPQNAPAYLKEYLVLNDSLQEEERKIRNKFARIRFETDEFIAENQLLERQRQLWIGIAIGLFLLAVAVLVILSQRAKNRNLRFQQQQQEANQEIFNLMLAQSQKVEEGKQFEQKRISEELHDGILGQMNGIRMVLLGLNKKTDPDAITMRGDAIEKLQGVQEEIRTISHELNDASYQKFHNFIISIEDLLTTICEPANLEFHFNYDESLDWDAISGDIKINLYRIIQESLQNCIKYASANLVEIKMDSTSDIIEVTIKDDGRGFDNKKVKKGIGHKNISSRVGKLNGDWSLVSKPGEGTMVTVKVPYVLKESEMIPQVNGKEKLEQLEKTSS